MCKAMEDMRNEAKLEERKEIACSLLADGELSYEITDFVTDEKK